MTLRGFFTTKNLKLGLKEIAAPHCFSIGEVLWDVIKSWNPTVRPVQQLGGSAAVFAYFAHQLGAHCEIFSATGEDTFGKDIRNHLAKLGLSLRGLQRCPYFPTGATVSQLREDEETEYTINQGVAWDDLEYTESAHQLAQKAEIIYFGSLAQRSEKSRKTIQRLLAEGNPKATRVMDVNIRQQFYNSAVLIQSFQQATVLKVSDSELARVAQVLMIPEKHDPFAKAMFQLYPRIGLIAVTSGASGSCLYTREGLCDIQKGIETKVVDTLGASDAFTATLALGWHRHMKLDTIHTLANKVAAYVCSKYGPTPVLPIGFRQEIGY